MLGLLCTGVVDAQGSKFSSFGTYWSFGTTVEVPHPSQEQPFQFSGCDMKKRPKLLRSERKIVPQWRPSLTIWSVNQSLSGQSTSLCTGHSICLCLVSQSVSVWSVNQAQSVQSISLSLVSQSVWSVNQAQSVQSIRLSLFSQ